MVAIGFYVFVITHSHLLYYTTHKNKASIWPAKISLKLSLGEYQINSKGRKNHRNVSRISTL